MTKEAEDIYNLLKSSQDTIELATSSSTPRSEIEILYWALEKAIGPEHLQSSLKKGYLPGYGSTRANETIYFQQLQPKVRDNQGHTNIDEAIKVNLNLQRSLETQAKATELSQLKSTNKRLETQCGQLQEQFNILQSQYMKFMARQDLVNARAKDEIENQGEEAKIERRRQNKNHAAIRG